MLAKTFILAGLLLFFASLTHAQEELDPVTVTATLHPVSSSVTGRNITVIAGERLAAMPVNSIDELLRYLPGIEVQMRGPMGSQSDIVVRGGTFQQVLVILDGIRLNDANTGHFSSYIPIVPSEIDRVEILKGAAAAIYGSEAVGGVIHIITKTFASKLGEKAKHLSAKATAGEYGLWTAQAGGLYSSGNTSVAAGVISNHADGQPLRGIDGYFHNTTVSASVNHFFNSKWSMALRSAYDNRDFAAQNFYTTFASDTATEKVTSVWNHLKLAYSTPKHSVTLDAGYKTAKDHYLFNNKSIANDNRSNLLQGLLVYKWQPAAGTTLSTGANWVNKQIKSNDRGDHQLNQAAAFAMLNHVAGRFTINPAVRAQWNETGGWELLPQLNLSYKLRQWQLRGSAGRTIRDADFTERFNNYAKLLVTSGSVGNPNLEQEHSISYEAGFDVYAIRNVRISSTFFQHFFTDLIDFVTTPYADMPRKDNLSPTGTFALAKNISKLTSTGFETDVQYNKRFSDKHQLWLTSGITWIDTEGADANSFYINSHARFLFNFSAAYSFKWLSASVNGLYKRRDFRKATSPVIVPIDKDYFVMNAKLQGYIYKRKLSVFTQLDNVLDRQYSDLLGSRMPGRWWMGGVEVRL